MRFVINGITLPIESTSESLTIKIAKETRLEPKRFSYEIIKKSIDARKGEVNFVYSVIVETSSFINGRNIKPYIEPLPIRIPKSTLKYRPVIVGFGPAGIFASLILARSGAKPIIIERGKDVEKRSLDIKRLQEESILDPESNVCYGEGGAGTFSDGKLNTGVNSPLTKFVLEEFWKHGAKKDILTDALPHIGSDYLRKIVKGFREEIISLGGEVLFESKLEDIRYDSKGLQEVIYSNSGSLHVLETDTLILAFGHSPYLTVKKLYDRGLFITPKDFSIGVRIEHLQKSINLTRYHGFAEDNRLPAASYKCVTHLDNGRAVYSFCMCPGGYVMNSSTELESVVTNGMSNNGRDNINGNAALLVPIKIADYFSSSPLDGFLFREKIERSAYQKEKPYFAPIQLVKDFLNDESSTKLGNVTPSYKPGVYFSSLGNHLPSFIGSSLKEGIAALAKQLSFMGDQDAILTGFETRSSSPVRIPRDVSLQANIKGIYPCGEGASYAGGITSASLDGIKVALKILGADSV